MTDITQILSQIEDCDPIAAEHDDDPTAPVQADDEPTPDETTSDLVTLRGINWKPAGSRGGIPLCPRSDCGADMAIRPAVSDRPGIVVHRPGPINVFLECLRANCSTGRIQLNMTRTQVIRAVSDEAAKQERR